MVLETGKTKVQAHWWRPIFWSWILLSHCVPNELITSQKFHFWYHHTNDCLNLGRKRAHWNHSTKLKCINIHTHIFLLKSYSGDYYILVVKCSFYHFMIILTVFLSVAIPVFFFCFFIYSFIHTLFVSSLSPALHPLPLPPTPLTSRQNLSWPLLQF
jgi:hypothetical protein